MLYGRFGDTSGRPYLEGRLFIPRLSISANISFLVDTGADSTIILPDDGRRIGIEYSKLKLSKAKSVGIGGSTQHYYEPAVVVFVEPGKWLYAYDIRLAIAQPQRALSRVPSLLGRNIINRWQMTYGPPRGSLRFAILSADLKVRLT